MANCYGQTITRLFVTSGWPMTRQQVNEAFKEFSENGWEQEHTTTTGYRCLARFDANIESVRRAAEANPGMIFVCVTLSYDSDDAVLHVGMGGTWVVRKVKARDVVWSPNAPVPSRYVRTMSPKSPKKRRRSRQAPRHPSAGAPTSNAPAGTSARPKGRTKAGTHARPKAGAKPRTRTPEPTPALNRLGFHGMPSEVELCRSLVLQTLPEAARAGVKYETTGSESYLSGTLEFTTCRDSAFRAFNRLVAQVPAISVSLEYADVKSGQRRTLRAIDGKIVEHRAAQCQSNPPG